MEFADLKLKKILFEEFLDEFEIDKKKSKFTTNKKIRIDGENLKPLLKSRFFKDKRGKYKIKRIIDDYFEFMIDIGLDIGIRTGLRLVIEDIQKDIMPYELLGNLSETETMDLPIRDKLALSTFVKIGNGLILDPSLEEEEILEARITIGVTDEGNHICSMQKGGEVPLTRDEILDAVHMAFTTKDDLLSYLD